MEKVQATGLRPGMVVMYNDQPHRVLTFTHRTPGKGNAVVQVKLRGVLNGVQTETRLMSTEQMERVSVTGRKMQYLYNDGDHWHFMEPETFEQYAASAAAVGEAAEWLKEEDVCNVTLFNGQPLSVDAPNFVELKIVETDPGVRGDTAQGGVKPAKLETGAIVKVPLFINEGEVIKVDTRSRQYVSRVK